ncbi:MAG TPA: hypothetical protein VNS63_02345 [Blastocatellia bacterium]|nr:hypothetical protein [Blastocatellia bacterium]
MLAKKLCAMILGLVLMSAAATTASAQSYGRYRDRNRGLSTGEKVGIIGGGAAAGVLIGGLIGGKKGAVIGGLLGGGGGGAYVYSRRNDDRWDGYRGYGYNGYRDSRYWRDRNFANRDFRFRNFRNDYRDNNLGGWRR